MTLGLSIAEIGFISHLRYNWLLYLHTPVTMVTLHQQQRTRELALSDISGPHLDEHARLVVRVGGEGLGLLGWDGGIPLDEDGHDPTGRLDAQGQGRDVQQQQVLHVLRLVT